VAGDPAINVTLAGDPKRRVRLPVAWTARLEQLLDRVDDDGFARRAAWFIWPIGVVLFVRVGLDQWFIRDDWAFLFTRDRLREVNGIDSMLLYPQDGHWMTWPIIVFDAVRALFGIGSYMPYLVVLWMTHAGIVLLVRAWMRRLGVTAWTTTLMTAVLFVFGAGWENVMFAVQIVYNFSLLAFLAHTLLVDHDGPVGRRDWWGVGLSLVGVSSSGFGPFFGFGVGLLLVLRRRWRAACVAVVPQAVAWLWWWSTWGADPAGAQGNAGPRFVWSFLQQGIWAVFGSLTGSSILAWPACLLCVALIVWPHTAAERRAPMIAMLTTTVVMLAGIGTRREIFGVLAAAWPRYQYVAAMIVAPVLAVGFDHARRFAWWAKWIPRIVLLLALVRNVGWLENGSRYWGGIAESDRHVFALVAGSPDLNTLPLDGHMSEVSPDVQIRDLQLLLEAGAIEPIAATSDIDRDLVAQAVARARATGTIVAP
jgi:hypothetical protein